MPPHNISHSDRELALIRRMSGEALPKPVNANGKLAEIVLKACAYNPRERYATAAQMRRDLEFLIRSSNSEPVTQNRGEQTELTQIRRTNRPAHKSAAAGSDPTHQDRAAQEDVTYRTSRTERTAKETAQGKFQKSPELAKKQPANNTPKKKKQKRSKVLPIMVSIVAVLLIVCVGLFAASGSGEKERVSLPEVPDAIPQTTAASAITTEATTSDDDVVDLKAIVTELDIGELDRYTNLQSLDLSGSSCYDAIQAYQQGHPNVDVTYTVEVGNMKISNKDSNVSLLPTDFSYDLLMENLKYLPLLDSISFDDLMLTGSQVMQLRNAYPDIALHYDVQLFGNTVDLTNAYLDLSTMSKDQVEEAVDKLGLLTNLTTVQLNDSLSLTAVAKLQDANPNALFKYNFTLFGQQLSTSTENVEFKNLGIGNEAETELRQALAILDNCRRFVIDGCAMDHQILADIRDDFREGPYLVWRVHFGEDNRYTTLTDDDTIRAVFNITDETVYNMRYLEKAKYVDVGHNDKLSDLSFVSYMPELEVLIASGCNVRDVSGFDNCKNLTWLELAYCVELSDISALAGCEGLKYLNISYSKVTSYDALNDLSIERFVSLEPNASTEEQNMFVETHPKGECITVFYGYSMPYGYGWRYDDNGKTMFWYYKDVIRKVFNYDQADAVA